MPGPPRNLIGALAWKAATVSAEAPASNAALSGEPDAAVADGSDGSGNDGGDSAHGGAQYTTCAKTLKNPPSNDKRACEEEAALRGVEVVLPHLESTEFNDSNEFYRAVSAYAGANNVVLRIRHSLLRTGINAKREEANCLAVQAHDEWVARQKRRADEKAVSGQAEDIHGACGAHGAGEEGRCVARVAEDPEPFVPELLLLLEHISHLTTSLRCTHGTYHAPRGVGDRYPAATRYTGCQARVSGDAKYDPETKTWRVVVSKENTVHNHAVSEALFDAYANFSMIDDTVLFEHVRGQIPAGGNGRIIRDTVSIRLGRTYTARPYDNLKHYHLGAGLAAANLEQMIDLFCAFEGARCLVIEDDIDDQVSGEVFQTGMQRRMFQMYGDSLILDWTHNTNNAGFFLGSLMATSASGKGVPVLNFLCQTQSKEMMKTILQYFVDENPRAMEKIQSVVIDKDYTEWKAIEEVLTNTMVVLCQFHMLKWLKQVIRDTKYNIDPAAAKSVMKILRGMVYSESKGHFIQLKHELSALLSRTEHADFHAYMQSRWYACKKMWANYKRGMIFTAGNTTSNRLESHWKQVKDVLGKRRRLDLFFCAKRGSFVVR